MRKTLKKERYCLRRYKMEGIVEFGDWAKIDLRVAEIKSVEDIEGADKLYKITLDVGSEIGERMICSGLKEFYSKEELVGKKIIYFSNLAPRKMRGIESQGMLLAAVTYSDKDKEKEVVLISPEKDIALGSRVS
jgi:methionine--tRNA ligase beta chain